MLSLFSKMVWAFQRSLAEKLSNQDNEAKLQVDLYKNINPDSSKTIIAATHRPNCAKHKISTLVNRLPLFFLRRN